MINKKRAGLLLAVAVLIGIQSASGASAAPVGIIQELLGTVTVTRAGEVIDYLDVGEDIENFDLIKTGPDGSVVIELNPGTGMRGTLVVKPKSAFTVKTELVRGTPTTDGALLAGSVGVKVKKISGDPALKVRSGNTVMGVRGTEFDVDVSVNDSLLVSCAEGRVVCSGEAGDELEALPGQAVEQPAGQRLRRVPVAVSSLKDFRDRWIADEITAFRGSPVAALDQFSKTYLRHVDDFRAAYAGLARDPVFIKWRDEFKSGKSVSSRDPATMKEKAAVIRKIMAVRRILFLFERVYYRLDEVATYVPTAALAKKLSNGQTVQDFLARVRAERAELARMTAAYRLALRMYADRNEGAEPVSLGEEDGAFFEDDDSFFD